MRPSLRAAIAGAGALAVLGTGAATGADDETKAGREAVRADNDVAAAGPLAGMPVYRPAKVGKPARTVGGGSRGPGDGVPALYVIVPDHVAQSASEQPSLFWYVDEVPKSAAKVEFTLLDEDGLDPLVQAQLEIPRSAGIQRIRLSDYAVELEPGTEYEWSVAIIVDPDERGKDIVSSGWIECVKPSGELKTRLAGAGFNDVHVLADAGLWYDALTALDDRLLQSPGDPRLRAMRASLLRQVGLDEVASAEVL